MDRIGGWSCDFAMPYMLLRWVGTVAAVRNYLSLEEADHTVTVAMSTHVAISWCCYLILAYARAPSRISSFDEFRRFFFSLPEFQIWCYAMTVLNIAIVTTFFLPKEKAVQAVLCYIAGFHGCLFYLAFEVFRLRRGPPIDEKNDARDALVYLEQQAASTRKRN